MAQFNMFNFLLAAIVFVILTAVFTVFIITLMKQDLKLTKLGGNDKRITKEYLKYGSKKHGCVGCVSNTIYNVVSALIALVMVAALVFSLMIQINEGKVCTSLPIMNVVQSGSMSFVNEKNDYIDEGEYTDQFEKFDIILTHKLPEEADLKVGDVVVYEVDDAFLVHRIVAIEEPNEKHPNERHFLLMGDANETPDRFPVRYSQMKSIYKGQHIAYVGTFVLFIQSPAGWLCVLLVVFAVIVTPIAERKLNKAKYDRLVALGIIKDQAEPVSIVDDSNVVEEEQILSNNVEQAEPDCMADDSSEVDVVDEQEDEENEDDESVATVADNGFGAFGEGKTFEQKIEEAQEPLASRYEQIASLLGRIEKIRVIRGKKRESYSKGRNAVAKLAIRGKTLNVFLALDPQEYIDTKYKFVDVSDSKTYGKTPMRLKLTSDRQTKWAKELIFALIEKHGWTILDEVAPVVTEQAQAELASVVEQEPVAEIDEDCQEMTETVEECQEMAEIDEDCQDLSNDDDSAEDDEQEDVVEDSEEEDEQDDVEEDEQAEVVVQADESRPFAKFGEGKTFEQKIEEAQEPLASRYAQISALLARIEKVRVIRGKKRESYSKGRNAVAKLAIRGKTLNVFLALDPQEYIDTKYKFVDVSDSKTYGKTPMRLKLTSDRQTKWAKELIFALIEKHGWTILDEVVEPVGVVADSNIVEEEQILTDFVEQEDVVEDVQDEILEEEVQEEVIEDVVEEENILTDFVEQEDVVQDEVVAEIVEECQEMTETVEQAQIIEDIVEEQDNLSNDVEQADVVEDVQDEIVEDEVQAVEEVVEVAEEVAATETVEDVQDEVQDEIIEDVVEQAELDSIDDVVEDVQDEIVEKPVVEKPVAKKVTGSSIVGIKKKKSKKSRNIRGFKD